METSSTSKTSTSTPASSPGLFSPSPPPHLPQQQRYSTPMGDAATTSSPYLHPLQMHRVRETHKAQVEQDFITGRKLINQYEIIDEIGRGVHGKVKLARSLETSEYVAIKIIQRFSKKRRLGKVTVSPEDKTKREIAILKKVRHPNVVGLLEVIDDPELKKIYMVLEHVERGEIVWRKKGTPLICSYERRRIEREIRGEMETGEEAQFFHTRNERRLRREAHRENFSRLQLPPDPWSIEHGITDEEEEAAPVSRQVTHESLAHFGHRPHTTHTSMVCSNPPSASGGSYSRDTSRAPSRAGSTAAHTPLPTEFDIGPIDSDNEDDAPGPLPSLPSNHSSAAALDAILSGQPGADPHFRGRAPSMADSIISHISSMDEMFPHDAFEEDFSYVPCFTIDQARRTFRDTVLGLEYLHYQGIVHRDIKPANLLWTKDYRVKISDFGVSYFGRPIRDGDNDDYVSESDAQDFDDDLELAKTVGTPAFFAPELCFTDLEVEQPKVTDQIDVWSLGVTLYCLIYARIPFLAEDEYQLFRAIANQDVHIPKRRLKAVNPTSTGSQTSLPKQATTPSTTPAGTYREDGELQMEEIDDELYDLIRRMLTKNPSERITIREVKRHPWVIKGIDNVIGWLDDTDPSRKTAGRKIQVDDRELERAVVPITFLERARSTIKKAVSKVIGRGETSRKRAQSNATSSGTEVSQSSPVTPLRDNRRLSLRGDESFFALVKEAREPVEHPLAQSVTASPEEPFHGHDPFAHQFSYENVSTLGTPRRKKSDSELAQRPSLLDRTTSTTASIQTVIRRLSHSRSFSSGSQPYSAAPLTLSQDAPFAFASQPGAFLRESSRSLHDARGLMVSDLADNSARTRSADRTLFVSNDKHGEPSVAMSDAVAPGNFEHPTPKRHLQTKSTEISPISPDWPYGRSSPHRPRSSMLASHQQSASEPDVPSMTERMYAASITDNRPSTATRTPEGRTPAPRTYGPSTAESFAKAQEQLSRRRLLEEVKTKRDNELAKHAVEAQSAAPSTCPPSPDDDAFRPKQEDDNNQRDKSSSSIDSVGVLSPITPPSDLTSPISSMTYSSANLGSCQLGSSSEQIYPSDPSLPTLISGASSISADHEGDFLANPGVVLEPGETTGGTPDTVTPPTLSKEPSHEIELPAELTEESLALPVVAGDDDEGYNADGDLATKTEDEDSDSDEGLTMSRKKPIPLKRSGTLVRRDTNASVGSTETAKKVSMTE